MKKLIQNKVDKKAISQFPRATFDGKIVVVVSQAEAERAVDYLLAQPVLGFDTETRPSFKKAYTTSARCCRFQPATAVSCSV